MPRCRSLDLALAFAWVWASASPARAGDRPLDPEARVHVDRGLEAYGEKRFEEAIRELEAAYKIDARREILFNWAQAERLSGDCAAATPLYEKFLEKKPPAAQAAQARRLMGKCRRAVKVAGNQEPPVPPAPSEEERRDEEPMGQVVDPWSEGRDPPRGPAAGLPAAGRDGATSDDEPAAPWYADWLGDTLVAGGVVGLTVGIAYFARSSATFDDASVAPTIDEFGPLYEEAKDQRRVAWISLGIGGALVGAGVARWWLVSQRGPTQAALAPLPGGATIVLGGRF